MQSLWLNTRPEIFGLIEKTCEEVVRKAEIRYEGKETGNYWYRFFRPDDPDIGGTARTFYATYSNAAVENILATASTITVPAGVAYVSFGWYCDMDFGIGGYLEIQREGRQISLLQAQDVWMMKEPDHCYFDPDNIMISFEQDVIDYRAYNAFGADQIGLCFPLLFTVATKSKLTLL